MPNQSSSEQHQQKIIVSIEGLNELFEVPVTDRPINLASNLECACVFLLKRFLDKNFVGNMNKDGCKELGFSVTDKEIAIFSRHITPQLMSYSDTVFDNDEYEDINLANVISDRNRFYQMARFTLALTDAVTDKKVELAG